MSELLELIEINNRALARTYTTGLFRAFASLTMLSTACVTLCILKSTPLARTLSVGSSTIMRAGNACPTQ